MCVDNILWLEYCVLLVRLMDLQYMIAKANKDAESKNLLV